METQQNETQHALAYARAREKVAKAFGLTSLSHAKRQELREHRRERWALQEQFDAELLQLDSALPEKEFIRELDAACPTGDPAPDSLGDVLIRDEALATSRPETEHDRETRSAEQTRTWEAGVKIEEEILQRHHIPTL